MSKFIDELAALLNAYSKENGSNTPDFILAQFLADVLAAWDRAVSAREEWYGKKVVATEEVAELLFGPTEERP